MRSAKTIRSGSQARRTDPVGPLRFLATMTSVVPKVDDSSSVSWWSSRHEVCVLLQRSGLAKVGEPRSPVFPVLDLAIQLASGHDRDVEVDGKPLEGPGRLGNGQLAAFTLVGR